jgi:hypothetical protein
MARSVTEELRRATRVQSALRPVEGDDRRSPDRRPFGWVALLVVITLAVGGWFLVRQLQADSKLQDCVMSGRKNCAPVDAPR